MENKTNIDWNDVRRYAEENNLMRVPLDKLIKKYLAYKNKYEDTEYTLWRGVQLSDIEGNS